MRAVRELSAPGRTLRDSLSRCADRAAKYSDSASVDEVLMLVREITAPECSHGPSLVNGRRGWCKKGKKGRTGVAFPCTGALW